MIYDSFSDVGESRVWFASASDPFFGLFWVISDVGSQIQRFQQLFGMKSL